MLKSLLEVPWHEAATVGQFLNEFRVLTTNCVLAKILHTTQNDVIDLESRFCAAQKWS